METTSNAEPKRSYSWWWDSHISPKNSKWLQDNLNDMDNKIKAMIKLIEEDADSFARRAEMYYKKRPDLMKLVEEFYRAYRALAERYDHVTGALRQAHRTIAVVFPNQIQLTLPDEPPSGLLNTGDEHTYVSGMQTKSNAIQWDGESLDEIAPFISKEGLKSLNWLFVDEDAQKKFGEALIKKSLDLKENEGKLFKYKKLEEEVSDMSKENNNLKNEITLESLRADKAEAELHCLKDAISKLKSELESAFLQYQISEERVSNLESELSVSQDKCLHLNDEISIKVSKLSITEEQCLCLERENTSLQLDLDNLNLVVSKQQAETSDLFIENQNLHNQVNSESKRADRAEADSTRLRDAFLRLKSEMESALLQYRLSQERISDLEAEISHTKEQFKNINHEMEIRASKLNLAEDHCLLLQEENKSLQNELDKFMKELTSQEKVIITMEEELDSLRQSIEFERQRNVQAEIMEKSLQTQLNKLEQRVEMQEEEIAIKEQELNKFKQHVEDGWEHRLQSERAHAALVELHSQSQEKMKSLGMEIQSGAEKLRKMEMTKSGLEEEIKRLHDENNDLNEENFSSVSKIICLQDEIVSLKASKHKIQDELRFNAEEKIFLQQELSSYKSSRNDLEEGHHDLMGKLRRMELREATFEEEMRSLHDENIGLYEKFFSFSSKIVNLQDDMICLRETNYRLEDELQFHLKEKMILQQEVLSLMKEKNVLEERHRELTENIEVVNCNVTSLQLVVKELLDGNKELRDACKKLDDEKACHLEQLMVMESMADKNVFLENSLSGANAELKILLEKIKGLEEFSEKLHENVHNHTSSEPVQVSHFKPVTQDTVKLSGKHSVLDNISDLNVEFDVLRGKVKALEEPCQSLYYQNSHLIAQNSNLVSQVERVGLHLQSLENRFVILEGKQVNIEEKDLALYNIQELHGKKELDDDICLFRNQMSDLSNQIHLLRKENQATKEELEEEYLKTVKSEIDNFIMMQFLVDLNETNLFLSKECRKYADKLDLAENFIFEFKQEWATQEMKLISMSDRNEKLLEGIHVMMKTYDTKKACESYAAKKDSEISIDGYDNILHKIVELHGTVAAAKGDIGYFQLENPFPFTLLEQLALILADLREQKKVLEQESLLRNQEISILRERSHELTEINEQAWKDINAGKQCQEMLTVEMERICVRLFELQETCHVSQSEISKLREENELLSKKLHQLRDQNDALKEENDGLLEKAITQEHLSLIFRSCNAEKSSDIDWLIRDVNCLYRITNDLDQEIRVINKNMRALEAENLQLKEEHRAHIVLLENKIHQARSALRKHDKETETRKKLLEQRGLELYYAGKKFLEIQSPELPLNPEGSILVINKSMVGRGELDEKKNFFSLFEENSYKDYEIGCLQKSNKILEAELLKLHKVVETLVTKEKNITSELQISINESRSCKTEATELLHDLHTSSFMELIFKEKFFELTEIFKGLRTVDIAQLKIPVEEIAHRNVQDEDLKEKLDVLGRENKGLKAELNAFAPLVVSLEKEIASLEEHTLSLTNLHILNSKRKQGNILASLQHKKCGQVRGKYQSPRASAVILDLKKLRAKVKALQKEVTDTEGLLEQGKAISGTIDKRKGKACKSTGTPKKKDIILDMRKIDNTGKDTEQLKDGTLSRVKHEQMKDIELDYVLSSSQREADFNVETDDHTLVFWDIERSENPSSELVLEKELNVDNLGIPGNYKESVQKWMDRLRESLSADAQRLLGLEKGLEELKMKIAASEMKCRPSASELNTVKLQVKDGDETLKKLTDFNHKLVKMAETFSLSSDSSKLRRKVLERVQRGAEKIDGLELKLQKVQCMLSKLQEEELESKAAKPVERRSKLPLKDLIYGKRSDPKQMKRRLCACMRFKTKEK